MSGLKAAYVVGPSWAAPVETIPDLGTDPAIQLIILHYGLGPSSSDTIVQSTKIWTRSENVLSASFSFVFCKTYCISTGICRRWEFVHAFHWLLLI